MKSNNIFLVDISTYTPIKTMAFYESIFGWKYSESGGYYTAYNDGNETAGLYETPDKFKQMKMPHFWMTYIQVNDVNKTVETAKKLGGIIELVDENNSKGKIALIRDPQGAGFTIYEGNDLKNVRTKNNEHTLIWNELHVSNAEKVLPFYQGIFNWTFTKSEDFCNQIYNDKNEHIADILEIPNEIKGQYEYWVCSFGVESIDSSNKKIIQNGGNIISDEGSRILYTDNSGEAFFYAQEIN